METNLDKYMPQYYPVFVYSDQAEEWFGINDGIIVAIENKNGIYNSATIYTLKQWINGKMYGPEKGVIFNLKITGVGEEDIEVVGSKYLFWHTMKWQKIYQ